MILEDDSVDYVGSIPGATLIDDTHTSQMMRRQRSDLSDTFKISCSPEAECYFKRKAEALYEKACRGELDIEISSIHDSNDELKVLPLAIDDHQEFEVTDLSREPILEVKPVCHFKKSSYESLYDSTKLENVHSITDPSTLTPEMVGDRFQGTFDKLGSASSYENLYSHEPTEKERENPRRKAVLKGDLTGPPLEVCFF